MIFCHSSAACSLRAGLFTKPALRPRKAPAFRMWAGCRRNAAAPNAKPSVPAFSSPEICIEILSPSNSRREVEEKKRLYLEAGALEVWTCGKGGTMKFFDASGFLPASKLCPEFPARVLILD